MDERFCRAVLFSPASTAMASTSLIGQPFEARWVRGLKFQGERAAAPASRRARQFARGNVSAGAAN